MVGRSDSREELEGRVEAYPAARIPPCPPGDNQELLRPRLPSIGEAVDTSVCSRNSRTRMGSRSFPTDTSCGNMPELKEWLGHSTLTMVMRYAHLAPGRRGKIDGL